MSASISDFSSTASNTSFTTAPGSMNVAPAHVIASSPASSIEQFKISETIRIRERLAELNCQDLRHYFGGIRALYDELVVQKEEYEIEAIVHQEYLKQLHQNLQELRGKLRDIKQNVVRDCSELNRVSEGIQMELKEKAPELAEKLETLQKQQKQLAYLKFTMEFTTLRDEIRRHLRNGNYTQLLENYRKLLRIPKNSLEYLMDEQCRHEYSFKSASLAQFLELELRSSLATNFARLHFPFEEPIDFKTYRLPLAQTAQILKCLKLVNTETLAATGGLDITGEPRPDPLEIVLGEFTKRFNYHFYGDKPTNVASKPEWFFTQLSYWAENNMEYFEQHVQPFFDEMYPGNTRATSQQQQLQLLSAKDVFLQHLMRLASLKVRELLQREQFVRDRRQLSHLIDECVLFEKEMQENYGYPEECQMHVIGEVCQAEEVLEAWIKLERDALSVGIDAILAEEDAYEPRYKEAADVDPYLVPNFADSFVILMQSMSERYRSIPDVRLQCRFLKLQLVIVDEFRSRIVQIGQTLYDPFAKPYPQLMNALWYLTLVLDDWSDSPEFVRLQYFLQQHSDAGPGLMDVASANIPSHSASCSSLARGTFDESASLYRHVWRQRVRDMCDSFARAIRRKLSGYAAERWYDWDGVGGGGTRPSQITPSMEPFLAKVRDSLQFIGAHVSPDSLLTLHHLTNHEVWSALDQCVISQTAFNYRGAAQILHDATQALIPLLDHCYKKAKGSGGFDIFNEKCVSVLSTLRLLSLPPPTAMLLKDELPHIAEQQLDQKLEQFNVVGLTKARAMEILEQRCDLVLLDKLIG